MIVLALLFLTSLLLFSRLSETAIALLLGLFCLGFVVFEASFSDLTRTQGALVGALFILSSALFTLGEAQTDRKSYRLKRKRLLAPSLLETFFSKGALQWLKPNTVVPEGRKNSGVHSGPHIEGYEIYEQVGSGGMASVYRAKRLEDSKMVALKVPLEKFVADSKFVRRFHREAEVLKRLTHPSVIRVYDHTHQGNNHFIAMEFIEGESLESILENHKVNFEQAITIIRSLADALRYIHSQGIIHRDIKPANVMVSMDGEGLARLQPSQIKLMDFGIAVGKVLTRLTMTGARVGTPIYMSPEQAKGQKLDSRSDIYSLGLLFYEIVAGQTPFQGNYEVIVHQQVYQNPIPPKQVRQDIPSPLSDLIMRMIEKNPDQRPNLNEIIEELDAGVLEERTESNDPSYLMCVVNTKKGVFRRFDSDGNLKSSVGNIPQTLPAVPSCIALDTQGQIYAVVITYQTGGEVPKMIRKYAPSGEELLAFGAYGLKVGELLSPISIAISPISDHIYILDGETCVIQQFNPKGEYIGKFGGSGDGKGTFSEPKMIVAGHDDFLYVLDYGNRQVQKFDSEGEYISRFAFKASKDDTTLRVLSGLGTDSGGSVYIADETTRKIRQISAEGKAAQSFPLDQLPGEDPDKAYQIVVDHQGQVYAARAGLHQIQRFANNGRTLPHLEIFEPLSALACYIQEGSELK
ncbi:MAG: protein kinase [Deinococcaceae bacterium]